MESHVDNLGIGPWVSILDLDYGKTFCESS